MPVIGSSASARSSESLEKKIAEVVANLPRLSDLCNRRLEAAETFSDFCRFAALKAGLNPNALAAHVTAVCRNAIARQSYDRRALRRRLFMYSANLIAFEAFWIPSRGNFIGRSTSCTRHFVLPPDAILIGRYEHPFLAAHFFSDLDDVIAKLSAPNPRT